MEILYKAFDGMIFKDEEECIDYENIMLHPNLFTIKFLDENENPYYICKEDIYDDDIYQKAEMVTIHSEDEYKDFLWLTEECGWGEFMDITSPGVWKRAILHGVLSDAIYSTQIYTSPNILILILNYGKGIFF